MSGQDEARVAILGHHLACAKHGTQLVLKLLGHARPRAIDIDDGDGRQMHPRRGAHDTDGKAQG